MRTWFGQGLVPSARYALGRRRARSTIASGYGATPIRRPVAWTSFVLFDREEANYTYAIENEEEIGAWAAAAIGRPVGEMSGYLDEVRGDAELSAALADRLRTRGDRNRRPRFGRRLGWYCLLRSTKPRLAVETGTADGLGTALLARGMQRNAAEGHPGELVSFDILPGAGWLLPDFLRTQVSLVTGDSAETLPQRLAGARIDMFLHDSAHTAEHERMELEFAADHAADRLLLLSDNAHASTELRDLSRRRGAPFFFVREVPKRHVYPGAAIGLAIFDRGPADAG